MREGGYREKFRGAVDREMLHWVRRITSHEGEKKNEFMHANSKWSLSRCLFL